MSGIVVPIPGALRSYSEAGFLATLVSDPAALGAWAMGHEAGNTQTGWGFPIGTPAAFRRIVFLLRAYDSNYPITRLRCRVHSGSGAGAILGNKVIPVLAPIGKIIRVPVDFDADMGDGSTKLWFSFHADGRCGGAEISTGTYPVASGHGASRTWTDGNVAAPAAASDSGTQYTHYVELYSLATGQGIQGDALKRRLDVDSPSNVVNFRPGFISTYDLGTPDPLSAPTFQKNIWNQRGWGTFVPAASGSFSAIAFFIESCNLAQPITEVVCRVRDTTKTGAIIATRRLAVNAPHKQIYRVVCDFGIDITPPAGGMWIEWYTNGCTGRINLSGASLVTPGAQAGYWPPSASIETTPTAGSAGTQVQVSLGYVTPKAAGELALTQRGLDVVAPAKWAWIMLDSTVYARSGKQFDLHLENLIVSNVPFAQLDVRVSCSSAIGTLYGSFWRLDPVDADAGTKTLTIEVFDGNRKLASRTISLVIKAATLTNTVTRKALFIGDSTFGGSGKCVIAEVAGLAANDPSGKLTLSLQGVQTATVADFGGTNRSIKGEAITGWKLSQFASDSTTSYTKWQTGSATGSPFFISGSFNFAQYLSNNSITMASSDHVIIHLGINDLLNIATATADDTTIAGLLSAASNYLDTMVTSIKAAVSGIRIGICMVIAPPPVDQLADALAYDGRLAGSNYRQYAATYAKAWVAWNAMLLAKYGGGLVSGVNLIPLHNAFNIRDDYPTATVAKNVYATATRTLLANGIHPGDGSATAQNNLGYWRMARAIWDYLGGLET